MKKCECGCKTVLQPAKKNDGLKRKGEYARFVSGHQSRVKPVSGRGWHEPWYYEQRKSI